jgi:hypothetical protein
MYNNVNETPSKRQQKSKKVSPNLDNGRNRLTPVSREDLASREEWAKVLATADRYY